MKEYEFLKNKIFISINTNYIRFSQFILGATITKEQFVFANNKIQNEYCLNVWAGIIGISVGVRGKIK